jgi:hypothetical protein
VGSIDDIVRLAELRPYLVSRLGEALAEDHGSRRGAG